MLMMTHAEYSKKVVGGTCTAHHMTFGGVCLNCGSLLTSSKSR
jgi:hypothetical protein